MASDLPPASDSGQQSAVQVRNGVDAGTVTCPICGDRVQCHAQPSLSSTDGPLRVRMSVDPHGCEGDAFTIRPCHDDRCVRFVGTGVPCEFCGRVFERPSEDFLDGTRGVGRLGERGTVIGTYDDGSVLVRLDLPPQNRIRYLPLDLRPDPSSHDGADDA